MTQFQAPINLVNEEKLPQIQEMVEDGLIVIEDEILKVTQKGRIFLRNIAYLFDSHISQEQKFSTSV
jgi:oxygen-independent coproporphyrinogen-3 oxidase